MRGPLRAWALVVVVAACSAPTRTEAQRFPRFDSIANRAAPLQKLPSMPQAVAAVTLDEAPLTWAAARIVRPASLCEVTGGLPVALLDRRPVIGEPHRVAWTTVPTVPPDAPSAVVVIVMSLKPAIEVLIPNGRGCTLQAHLDYLFTPQNNSMITQSGGYIELNWTPPPQLRGVRINLQMLVADDLLGNNLRVSPLVELTPGNR